MVIPPIVIQLNLSDELDLEAVVFKFVRLPVERDVHLGYGKAITMQ